jgi:hypothetical protein
VTFRVRAGTAIRTVDVDIDALISSAHAGSGSTITYEDGNVERIEGSMILERLDPGDADTFVKIAYRLLEPWGQLILELPDLNKVCRLILSFGDDSESLETGPYGLRAIFGDPAPARCADRRKWAYTPALVERLMRTAGFERVSITDGFSQGHPLRDMRVEAVKMPAPAAPDRQ